MSNQPDDEFGLDGLASNIAKSQPEIIENRHLEAEPDHIDTGYYSNGYRVNDFDYLDNEVNGDVRIGSAKDFLAAVEKTLLFYNGFEDENPVYDQVVHQLDFNPLAR